MTLREKHPLICIELAGPHVLAVDLGKPSHDSSIDCVIPWPLLRFPLCVVRCLPRVAPQATWQCPFAGREQR
jgi:hypothetical protein